MAIALVVAYHLGYLGGGWLGVDLFFVLSGYLITSILLEEGESPGRLRQFWGHRARRLFPALMAMLLVLAAYAWARGPELVPAQLRWPALATVLYGANWQQVSSGSSYFAQYMAPSPLSHTWSLAIEEQYYLLAPLLMTAALVATRRVTQTRRRFWLITVSAALAVVSALWMGFAAHTYGANRAYLGTDTRAWELLLGGVLAVAWPAGAKTHGGGGRWKLLAGMGTTAVALGVWSAGGPPTWVWNGGLVGIVGGAGLVVVGVVQSEVPVLSAFLRAEPLRWLGLISYSLYLWHWPAIVLITHDSSGLAGWRLLTARIAAMLTASVASYYLIERPLRRFDWAGLARRLRIPSAGFATAGLAVTAVAIVAATTGPPVAGSSQLLSTSPQQIEFKTDLPRASPSNPYRVWIIGDSVMYDGSLGVTAALQSTGEVSVVANNAFPGWGLTRDPAWGSQVQSTTQRYRPQIVIGTWSWDDAEAQQAPQIYLQRLIATLHLLLSEGTGVKLVVLMQFPQSGPSTTIPDIAARAADWRSRTAVQRAWDRLADEAVKGFPGRAVYLTTDQLFAPGGRFLTWFPTSGGGWLRGRKLDNAHLCPYGAAQWGALVTADLAPALNLPAMRPGWELGAWTKDHRYNDPPGACPDDQPPRGYNGVPVP